MSTSFIQPWLVVFFAFKPSVFGSCQNYLQSCSFHLIGFWSSLLLSLSFYTAAIFPKLSTIFCWSIATQDYCQIFFPFEVVYIHRFCIHFSRSVVKPLCVFFFAIQGWIVVPNLALIQNLVSTLLLLLQLPCFWPLNASIVHLYVNHRGNRTHRASGTRCLDVKKLAINHANCVLCLATIITPFRLVDAIAVRCWFGRSADHSSLLRPALLTEFLLSLFRSGRLLYFRRNRVKSRDTEC